MTGPGERDDLAEIVSATLTLFPEFAFLSPGGVLSLNGPWSQVERVRIELPGECLHLQSVGIDAVDVDDVAAAATVSVSSWYKEFGARFDPAVFFDFDHPTGTQVHTVNNGLEWIDIDFENAVDITSLRLRNVDTATSLRARLLRVLVTAGGQTHTVFDGAERATELGRTLDGAAAHRAGSPALADLMPVLAKTIRGEYLPARIALDEVKADGETKKHFRKLMSTEVLAGRSMEWTIHGLQRSFRFWSPNEKRDYTRMTAQAAQTLSELTPNVCFGFGAALAVVRDGDFIPHDDDLDLIIGFEPHEAPDLPAACRLVEEFLTSRGYTVKGNFTAHRHVSWKGGKPIDVFAGLFEGDTISWYPGKRGSLQRDTMFPVSSAPLHGVTVPLPRNPLLYLETVYGAGWRRPDPGFTHRWNNSAYADLVKRPEPATG